MRCGSTPAFGKWFLSYETEKWKDDRRLFSRWNVKSLPIFLRMVLSWLAFTSDGLDFGVVRWSYICWESSRLFLVPSWWYQMLYMLSTHTISLSPCSFRTKMWFKQMNYHSFSVFMPFDAGPGCVALHFQRIKTYGTEFWVEPSSFSRTKSEKIFIRACVEIYVDHTSDGRAGRPSGKRFHFSIPHMT